MPLSVTVSWVSDAGSEESLDVRVRRLTLHEAISELFDLRVEVLSTDSALAPEDFVGRRARVRIQGEPFHDSVTGIVRTFLQKKCVPSGDSEYEIVLAPTLFLATLGSDRRIFQAMDSPAIVAAIVGDQDRYASLIPAPETHGSALPTEYRVQYDESDHRYITRILAEDGFAYFFRPDGAWVLEADTSQIDSGSAQRVPFRDPSQLEATAGSGDSPHVQDVELGSSLTIASTTVRHFDERRPRTPVQALAFGESTGGASPELYLPDVGRAEAPSQLQAIADQALERATPGARTLVLGTNFRLAPGHVLVMEDHPRGDLGDPLLVVRAYTSLEFEKQSVRRLTCVPLAGPFRPLLVPKPRVHGTESALVVGAEGTEIDVDAEGRVDLKFPWDRRGKTSGTTRRVRVSHGWAGPSMGFILLPRVGHEVLVTYLNGNPDEPVVTGRVFDGANPPPLSLPGEQMISTWRSLSTPGGKGYNEILMDDSADAERLQLHAQKNFISVTENDSFTMIKGNSYTEILKDENHTVHGRSNIVVKKGVNASVGGINATSYGDATFKVVGTLTFDATADRYDITGGNHFIRPSSLYVNVRDVAKFQGPHFHAHMGDSIELMVGGSKIRIEDGTISITSGTITINGKSAVTIVGDPVKLNP